MIAKGEAYMRMLPAMQMLPTIADLFACVWTRVRTSMASEAKKIISPTIMRNIFVLFFRSEYSKNSVKYTPSIANPVPFVVTTKMLCGCTSGIP